MTECIVYDETTKESETFCTLTTISDAIKVWCEKTGILQNRKTEPEMVDFINAYEYEDEDAYFCINNIEFE